MKFNLFVLASLISGMCFGNLQRVSFNNPLGHEYSTGACKPFVESPNQFNFWKACIQRQPGPLKVIGDDSSALWRYFERDCNSAFKKAYNVNGWFKCLSRYASNAEILRAGNS